MAKPGTVRVVISDLWVAEAQQAWLATKREPNNLPALEGQTEAALWPSPRFPAGELLGRLNVLTTGWSVPPL